MVSTERRAEWESQTPPKPNNLYEEPPALWRPKSCAGKRQPSGQAAGAVPFTEQDEHSPARNPNHRSASPAVDAVVAMHDYLFGRQVCLPSPLFLSVSSGLHPLKLPCPARLTSGRTRST